MGNYHITTTITTAPFRCVVCGYVDEVLHTRRETGDPWAVMFTVDTVHQLIGASQQALAIGSGLYEIMPPAAQTNPVWDNSAAANDPAY